MILLLDSYDSFTYNLYQGIAPFDEVKVVRNDRITLQEIIALEPSGIVLSPGPGTPEKAGILISLLKYIVTYHWKVPLLGVCLGHQAIAHALGGKIIPASQIIHGKSDLIFHEGGILYQGLSTPFKAARYHSLLVEEASLPHDMRLTSRNEDGLIMGLEHTTLPLHGVQFHPESILTPEGSQLLQNFTDLCRC
ncbi:MAG: aminodeoxychorismate/anthranilate synthase component II [Verrucomicrobia bacterium]|nr:MAG: aminodeoxychorismate/anthranilate synthase component II [Verrucomicrobiota bacterium]